MKLENTDITAILIEAENLLATEEGISPAFKVSIKLILAVMKLLIDRLRLNSSNSSIPPSQDPNREKKKKRKGKKAGGQKGHEGHMIEKISDPEIIKDIPIDRSKYPEADYIDDGYESRQIIDIKISRVVTEYRAQVVKDEIGRRFTAEFPEGVNRPVQYGNSVKAHAVYISQYQLIPYNRVEEHFKDWLKLPISAGSIYNFNLDVYHRLELFENILKEQLLLEKFLNVDETGINVGGKRKWLHCVSNSSWTYYYPHEKRGSEAMDEMGILPYFSGLLCHDHWKPYYNYDCMHCLCNAHHLRELQRAWEVDKYKWAKAMIKLLLKISQVVGETGGQLAPKDSKKYRNRYHKILAGAEVECPPPDESQRKKGQRGRLKRSKSRNLLERLRDFEEDVLRFMDNKVVEFTNNQGERDIRMTKVHQKISGCFRSMKGALIHARIKSYLSTCSKNEIGSREALEILFNGKLPDFTTQEGESTE
ncbi:MAG: IS66 family transposase [Bacteroidetes bacterium]|nr:IS66 family transposase [Bacteroidota bacterium]